MTTLFAKAVLIAFATVCTTMVIFATVLVPADAMPGMGYASLSQAPSALA